MEKLEDDSPMPWGEHKDKAMADVPERYLLYMYNERGLSPGPVKTYIEENMDVIKHNHKRDKK